MIEIERVINSNYIRYDRLNRIIPESTLVDSDSNTTMVYIDLNSILKPIYQEGVYIDDTHSITSCIVNMCAHYRDYFWNKYRVNAVFFIVYSNNIPSFNTMIYSEYNLNMKYLINNNKIKYDNIRHNLNILKTICPYLPDIFFIEREVETGVIIYDIINKYDINNSYTHIILTKDVYNYQLVGIDDRNVVIFKPSKKNNIDESIVIDKNNVLNIFLAKRKSSYKPSINIHHSMLSLIMSINNMKERGIKTDINMTKTIKYIESMIISNMIINGYNSDIMTIGSYISRYENGYSSLILQTRFKCIDIKTQLIMYNSILSMSYNEIINVSDPISLKNINNKYFIKNPLDLDRL